MGLVPATFVDHSMPADFSTLCSDQKHRLPSHKLKKVQSRIVHTVFVHFMYVPSRTFLLKVFPQKWTIKATFIPWRVPSMAVERN